MIVLAVAALFAATASPHVKPTDAPGAVPPTVTVRAETDKAVYGAGEAVGVRIVITNSGTAPQSVAVLAQDAPEYGSVIRLTRPDGSACTCMRAPGNLSISGIYRRMRPGEALAQPESGFRPLAKWQCAARESGTYTLLVTRQFLDPRVERGFTYIDSNPVTFRVKER
jgi:hypothetical protein